MSVACYPQGPRRPLISHRRLCAQKLAHDLIVTFPALMRPDAPWARRNGDCKVVLKKVQDDDFTGTLERMKCEC
jgi:hypothetical protein